MTATLITDHPAWTEDTDGTFSRLVVAHGSLWRARWDGTDLQLHTDDRGHTPPAVDRVDATQLPPATPAPLRESLAGLGTVVRLPNPSLWDAITTAVLRQVVRAAQARAVYGRWCSSYGTPVSGSLLPLVPEPKVVLDLADEDFATVGAAFHRPALRATATAYLEHAEAWAGLPAKELMTALEGIQRIGPWTASAAVADYTGDFSLYPYGDLAVRTWAHRAAPQHPWPEDERVFAAGWRGIAPDRTQLHALTLFTLAWGIHARNTSDSREPARQP